jgi:hypothetical protein
MALIPKANINTVGQGVSRATIDKQSGVMRTAEDFGAQFGNDLEKFGATGARVSANHLDNLNRAAVMDADNQFSTEARQITLEAKQLKGKNAEGAMKKAEIQLQTSYDIHSQNLKSPAQQRAFRDAAMRTRMQNLQQVEYHEVKENMVYQKETEKAKLLNYSADSVAAIGSNQYLEELFRGYTGTESLVRAAGKREGKSAEVIDAEVRIAKDNFHQQMLRGIGASDSNAALEYLNNFEDDFSKGELDKLRKTYKASAVEQNSTEMADAWYMLPAKERDAKLKTIKDGDERKRTSSIIQDNIKRQEKWVKDDHDNFVNEIELEIEKDPKYKVPSDPRLTADDLSSFRSRKKSVIEFGKMVDDPQTVYDLDAEMDRDPKGFKKRDMSKIKTLTVDSQKKYRQAQNKMVVGETVEDSKIKAKLLHSLRTQKVITKDVTKAAAERSDIYIKELNEIRTVLDGLTPQQRNDPKYVDAVVTGVIADRVVSEAIEEENLGTAGKIYAVANPFYGAYRVARHLIRDEDKVSIPESLKDENVKWERWRWVSKDGRQFDRLGRQFSE